MSTPIPIKRGRMGHDEMKYIRENIKDHGAEAVAKKLNRTTELIAAFAKSEGIAFDEDLKDDISIAQAEINKELRKSPEWEALKQEFTTDEVDYFAYRFSKLIPQFKDNLLATEETQIFQLLKFEILMQRNMKGAKRASEDIRRMENELAKLYSKYENEDMPDSQRDYAMNIETQLLASRSAQNSKSTEFVKLQEKHSSLLKELKATREQRISKIENSAKDILSLLKDMQNNKFRAAEGRQQALVNLAVEKETRRLGEYHTYEDGGVDRPILSSDTIGDD